MDSVSSFSGTFSSEGKPSSGASELQLRWRGAVRGVPISVLLVGESADASRGLLHRFVDWVRERGDQVLRVAPPSLRAGQRLPPGLPTQIRSQCTQAPLLISVEDGHRFALDVLQSLVNTVVKLGNGRSAMVVIAMPGEPTPVPKGCLEVRCHDTPSS
jgi:hypothetical protein